MESKLILRSWLVDKVSLLVLNIKIMRQWIADFSFMLNFTVKTMNVCNTGELKGITGIYLSHHPYGSAFIYFH